ncbi:MAG: NAD(P)/FAD-dependent oxidoreductase [Clostridia bacterium]|nr:NAD(P)/FAD-dependent oxidoreductase [Clostridia bacterium]
MKRVIVIGGGAAGLMAAYAAAKRGNHVLLIEQNEKLGKKIYITGKGRCNLTNDCLPDEFLQNVVRGGKFMTGSVYAFSPQDMMNFLEEYGLPLKTERGNRVFPMSDKASDVTRTLEKACKSVGVVIQLNEKVLDLRILESTMRGVITDRAEYECDCVIICTGGLSYPSTGSTGDGYRLAQKAGHKIVPCIPSLVGINLKGDYKPLQGISLKNVVLTAKRKEKTVYSALGEMLFTHYGVSGPLVLTLSSTINRHPINEISLFIDLKPALNEEKLDARILRDFSERKNEQMKNVMRALLPQGLVKAVLNGAGISMEKRANAVTKEERSRLVKQLKEFPLKPTSLRDFSEAIITSGGVDVKEINPKTMESKFVKGLYLCGELLDVDAFTGGFNLQIAFSSGFAAGNSIN